jgi:hypothetical protein
MSPLRAPHISLAERHVSAATPLWPFWTALFVATLALAAIGPLGWWAGVAFHKTMLAASLHYFLVGALASIIAGVGFSLFAATIATGEMFGAIKSNGRKSIQIFVLGTAVVMLVGLLVNASGMHWGRLLNVDVVAPAAIAANYIIFTVAWPLCYVIGLAYGFAAMVRRGDRPMLGAVGVFLNGSALFGLCSLIHLVAHDRYFMF